MNVPCRWHAFRRVVLCGCAVAATLVTAGCAVGPDYRKPTIDIPPSFKEDNVEWQQARADPQATLSSTWWRDYHDDTLTHLVDEALEANQSIAQAEAAYRLAQATVSANTASLFPTISAGISGSRAGTGTGAVAANGGALNAGVHNTVTADVAASWELDLWGQVRREIESSKASAQASDAQLAGQRLSIASSVVTDYFELRRADVDIDFLEQQRRIDAHVLDMTRASYTQGEASNDSVLAAQDNLELVIADLQSTQTSREQYEHAIAVLTGVPPGKFSIAPDPHYAFVAPAVPLTLPSQLLERRYDVVSAERTAASANAKIGAAKAAYFPNLTLSAEGGFQHSALANLFSVPNRFWTVGPQLAGTIFDGGARTAAVHEARATYDEAVAAYRQAVLSAFENVEDSLSSSNHLAQQERAYADIYQRNKRLFESEQAQFQFGTASEQSLLTQQLTLLLAQQNLADTQASLTLSSVTLIKNLGGGWQWDEAKEAPADVAASSGSSP